MANSTDVKIVVLGVGGGGGNAVNNMVVESNESQIKFVVVNTDQQDIEKSIAQHKVLIAPKNKKSAGLGAGAKPEVGQDAAESSIELIREHLTGADMCFIAAGLGGGTGSGAAHVIAKLAKEEMDITTVAVVTKPFHWEGKRRSINAEKALEDLAKSTDVLVPIPNDKVADISDKKTTVEEAFKAVDNVLRDGVLGITDLITKTGIINLDFADVQAIVKDAGLAHMGIGIYRMTGNEENPVLEALTNAIKSDLLETSITGAKRIMINYTSSEPLSMLDISQANEVVYEMVDEDVNLIWGNAIDSTLQEGEVKATVIATEFNEESCGANEIKEPSSIKTSVNPLGKAQEKSTSPIGGGLLGSYNFAHRNTQSAVEPKASAAQKSFDINEFKSRFGRR